MAARGMTLGVLLVAVILATACGYNDRSSARTAMDHKFQQLDFRMASIETLNSGFDPHLASFTRQYIALVRRYADQLGPSEAKRRLNEKGDEVAPYCLPCKATLEDAAKRY